VQISAERSGTERSSAPPSWAIRLAIGLLIGLVIGAATSFAQSGLDGTWQALSNSASPWLLGAFIAGAIQLTRERAVAIGLSACVLEVAAYYAVTTARGYPANRTEIVFWGMCAVIGGPIFGWAGWASRHEKRELRPIGGCFLPATFISEALGTYQLRLHYRGDVILYAVIGLVLCAALVIWTRQPMRTVLATAAVTAVGILIYWLGLDAVAGATFGA
jgi:hypothetical protein